MSKNKTNKDFDIPSIIVEIEIYQVGDKHYLSMVVENKQIQICVEELKVSPFTKMLICKWIEERLKEEK